jgi:asparagine N-glycosylation enzyme membrane subunit Stt3
MAQDEPAGGGGGHALVIGGALFALAFAVRCYALPLVLDPERVHFPHGADELYHLRRILYAYVHFPGRLDFDPYLNFPHGGRAIWPPAFDWLLAALARLLVRGGDLDAATRLVSFAPPVLGAATVVLVAGLGRRLHSPRAGFAAGLLLALLPAHVMNSQLGNVDHHVAVGLATTLLLWAGTRLAGAPSAPQRRLWLATQAGVAIAGNLLLWPGSLLHVLVFQAVLGLHALLAPGPAEAAARARAFALCQAVATLLILPSCLGQHWEVFGDLTPLALSRFQPLWLGAGAAALLALSELWARTRAGAGPRARALASVALLGAALPLALAALPSLGAGLQEAGRWFESGGFQEIVGELRPLLGGEGSDGVSRAHLHFSWLFWGFAPAWLWLARRARDRRSAAEALVLAWAAVFFALTLHQLRFLDSLAVGFVLVLGAAYSELWERATRTLSRRSLALGVTAALATALVPCWGFYEVGLAHWQRLSPGARIELPYLQRQRELVGRAARWLARESPPTRGYLDASEIPEYGVLAPWGDGHLVRHHAQRPVVQDNFGPYGARENLRRADAYYAASDEEEAYRTARALRVRYVFATRRGSGQRFEIPRDSMTARLWWNLGGIGWASQGAPGTARRVEALGRHRLVYVGDDADLRDPAARAQADMVAIYELVEGALVEGGAEPGQALSFELWLELEPARLQLHRREVRANVAGRYALRLPYPTDAAPSSLVRTKGPYRVGCGARLVELSLSDVDVRAGRRVRGPDFAPGCRATGS